MSKSPKILFCVYTEGMPPFVFKRKDLFDRYSPGSKPSKRKGFKTWNGLMAWVAEQDGGKELLAEGVACPMDAERSRGKDRENGFVAMRYSTVNSAYEQKLCMTQNEAMDWLVSRKNQDEKEEERRGDKKAVAWSKWLPQFLMEEHGNDIEKLDAFESGWNSVWTMSYLETFLRQTSSVKAVLPGGMLLYLETERVGDRIYVVSTGFSWDGTALFESAFFLIPDNGIVRDEVQREALAVACALDDISLQQTGPLCILLRNRSLCHHLSRSSQEFMRRDAGRDYGAVASLLGMVAVSGKDVRMVYLDAMDARAKRTHEILEGILPERRGRSLWGRMMALISGRMRRKEALAVRLDKEAIACWSHPSSLCVRKERLLFAICMPGSLEAYTDASFHGGKAGCSATVYWNAKMAFRVDLAFSAGWLTSSKAELLAILNLVLHIRDGSALKIYTDYMDVTFEREEDDLGLDGDVTDYLVLRGITQRLLSVAGIEIAWVKGHSCDNRNRDADLRARSQRMEFA